MNLNDPKTLAADLLHLSVYLEMVNQSLHRLTAAAVAQAGLNAPDAGMVVVKAEGYWPWGIDEPHLLPWWFYLWFVEGGHEDRPHWQVEDGGIPWPHPQLNLSSVSHLTIADGRGEGEVLASGHPCYVLMFDLWAGPDADALNLGWWEQRLSPRVPWAYNHDYGHPAPQWWQPDESTAIDCAAVPHAMIWRAA